ncbi:post-GPI attachment to proteins factor 3-like protein [Chytriomyces sp. MP71]|nr:post-GPI attachment to proteins factor 3-like protein [Chytriomyces sp. MP71]
MGRIDKLLVSLLLLLPLIWTSSVQASSGDRLKLYQNCVNKCAGHECDDPLPLILQLTGWDCVSNCRYLCSHKVTAVTQRKHNHIHQFHGKWPFIRMLGVQEPASALFSVLNGIAHLHGYRALMRLKGIANAPAKKQLRNIYALNAIVCMAGWVFSTIFHTRDLAITEKLDYFGAVGGLLFNMYIALNKLSSLATPRNRAPRVLLRAGCLLFYAAHVTYLSLWPFDYGYNMKAGITVAMVANLAWLTWCWRKSRTRPYAWKMVAFVVLVVCAMALEVLDFPPYYWVFDAHSLWHAATVPLTYLLYSFFLDDVRFDEGRIDKKE